MGVGIREKEGGAYLVSRSRAKSKGVYAPLGAQYYLDDAILAAGPTAELAWVRILSFLASIPSDGYVTESQVARVVIGIPGKKRAIDRLVEVGLLEKVPGGFVARSWLKWNKTVELMGKIRTQDQERHAAKNGDEADIPTGNDADSVPQSSTEQSSTSTPKGVDARKRGTRIPDPFIVTADMRRWASERCPAVDVDRSTEKFVNHWRSTTRNATKLDWEATWRNWLMNDQDRNQSKPTPTERARRTVQLATEIDLKEITA